MPERHIGVMVGERVHARRKRLGLTQARLSALTGTTQGNIARIETGNAKEVESSTLIALAKALRVTTDWLLGLTDDEAEEQPGPGAGGVAYGPDVR